MKKNLKMKKEKQGKLSKAENNNELYHLEQLDELSHMKDIVKLMKSQSDKLEKDVREARILLFMAMAILVAILGTILGIVYSKVVF